MFNFHKLGTRLNFNKKQLSRYKLSLETSIFLEAALFRFISIFIASKWPKTRIFTQSVKFELHMPLKGKTLRKILLISKKILYLLFYIKSYRSCNSSMCFPKCPVPLWARIRSSSSNSFFLVFLRTYSSHESLCRGSSSLHLSSVCPGLKVTKVRA